MKRLETEVPPSRTGIAVVVDFDGTLTVNNLAELALRRFAEEGWEDYDKRVREGALTLEEGIRLQFGMIRAESEHDILAAVKGHGAVRDGFADLVRMCDGAGVPLVIASGGLDFIIDHVLQAHGLGSVPVICARAELRPEGILVEFPSRFSELGEGDFKEGVVRHLRSRGDFVIHVGNGLSDLRAARLADSAFVIANSSLEIECTRRGYPFTAIETFWPVVGAVSKRLR